MASMQLNPKHLTVSKLLQGRLFRIPEYQRAYSWQKRQREDLFKDIVEAHRSGQEHFMATVVALARDRRLIAAEEFSVVELVDGQQRVTTLVILLKALERALTDDDKAEAKIKADIVDLLVKGDEHNLVLLQTNHDSSDIFLEYIRNGKHNSTSVVTASDRNLLDAAADCEKFVHEWTKTKPLVDLLATVRNRLSVIYHEIGDESTVYRVFEVLNSRGLDVKWIDKTKSQLMASIFEHVTNSRADSLKEMQTIWQDIYRLLGLRDELGDEALRFAGTWRRPTRPNRILGEEEASAELLQAAGEKLKTIVETASWLRTVARKVLDLNQDVRRVAVTRIGHARFLAIAIMLREFDASVKDELLGAWERVTFRIFSLGGKDTRYKVGEYVRLGYDVYKTDMPPKEILKNLLILGEGYSIDEVLGQKNVWDNWYDGWAEEVRYLLYRYDEHLAHEAGSTLNSHQWGKIWAVDPAKSVEHILPQSSGKDYVHHLGNLTMLPPNMNSSLRDKPPKQKASRYLECGLQATMVVGRGIESGIAWNKDAIIQRAARMEEFVRKEWAD